MKLPFLEKHELSNRPAIIGMLHVPALPGAPLNDKPLSEIIAFVERDAAALVEGGVDALMLENFFDTPFYPGRVPVATVTQLTRVALAVREKCDLPLGINVLRNDGEAAIAIAHAVGAAFVRINILTGARVTDQGVIEGKAHDVLRLRDQLGAREIAILADVDVKHSAPLGQPRAIEDEVADLLHRGGADGLIVSGSATGQATDVEQLKRVRAAAGDAAIFVGSGVTAENAAEYKADADGLIVGTSLKCGGAAEEPVDVERVRALLSTVG